MEVMLGGRGETEIHIVTMWNISTTYNNYDSTCTKQVIPCESRNSKFKLTMTIA
jgi:hypothetical protein